MLERIDAAFRRLLCMTDNILNLTLWRNLSARSPGSATTNTSFCQLNETRKQMCLLTPNQHFRPEGSVVKTEKFECYLRIEPLESF